MGEYRDERALVDSATAAEDRIANARALNRVKTEQDDAIRIGSYAEQPETWAETAQGYLQRYQPRIVPPTLSMPELDFETMTRIPPQARASLENARLIWYSTPQVNS